FALFICYWLQINTDWNGLGEPPRRRDRQENPEPIEVPGGLRALAVQLSFLSAVALDSHFFASPSSASSTSSCFYSSCRNLNVAPLERYSCSHWFRCSTCCHSAVFTIAANVASHHAICAGGIPFGPTTARQFEVTALMPSSRQVGTPAASPLRRRG